MKAAAPRPLKYRCPVCGKRTTFGTHFCEGDEEREAKPILPIALKQVFSAIIAILLIELFLWQMIGMYSLYFLVLAPILGLLFLGIRRLARRGSGPSP